MLISQFPAVQVNQFVVSKELNFNGQVIYEITIVDKSTNERLKLIAQLEDEDKNAIFRIIDGMLTKARFKDFFNKNVAAL